MARYKGHGLEAQLVKRRDFGCRKSIENTFEGPFDAKSVVGLVDTESAEAAAPKFSLGEFTKCCRQPFSLEVLIEKFIG